MIKRTLTFLDRLHWLWLAMAAPFMLFPSPKRSLAMLVIPALFLLRWLAIKANQKKVPRESEEKSNHRSSIIPNTPLNGALLLMSVMVLVSLWATFDINYSLPKICGVVLGMGVFFALVREGTRPRGWTFGLLAFLGMGLTIATLGFFGTSWFSFSKIALLGPIITHLPRLITGLQGAESGFHPNEVAGGLIWVLPLIMAVSVILLFIPPRNKDAHSLGKNRSKKIRDVVLAILCLAAASFIAVVFLLCQSRGGYIALALTLIILIPTALPSKWRWYILAILAVLAIVVGVLLASRWDAVRIWITGSNLVADPALSLNSLSGRVEVWSRAIYGIQDFPFTGMGMNAFRKVMPVLYPLFNISPEIDLGHAHNEFLQAALDLGIPGLIAFLALYIGSFWMLVDTWRRTRLPSPSFRNRSLVTRILTLGLGGSLLAHLLYGLTDAVALGAKPGILFWMLLGLTTAFYQQAQEYSAARDSNISFPGVENNGK
jgi:putative inorganic carbon (HCO3(-)) transporter